MQLTPRAVAYLATEEGIALESYLDSADPPNWTWAMGLTASAKIAVQDQVHRPAPLVDCIRASTARLNAVYMPAINRAFAGHPLNDGQLAAALSFHWSTDASEHADWANA
ncbi:hypothetical protein [Novosphingobium sp.]|uniref:hypothetical protein n=1 Tax=Novosphingobium sp. TaxID=1874826 RepID=UPI00334019BA